jgi:serine phosphatase RsbU (regulator of sigma subunit)
MKESARQLIIRDAEGRAQTVDLEKDRYTLGRSSAADLCYPDDAGLSRQHLVFERVENGWQVTDLGSKNGTLLNGVRIDSPTPFRPGDRVSAGHLSIEFADIAATLNSRVVFVEQEEAPSQTTVVASLEGVLSPEPDAGRTYVMQTSPQMRALIRAGRELAIDRPVDELCHIILDLSMDAVLAGRGVVMTLENDELVPRAARGEGFRISSTIRDRVVRQKESLLVRDTQLDQALRERRSIVQQKVRSLLAVPLQTNDRVIGLIYLDSPHLVREFTREDLNLLTVMANVAAIRIEHIRLAEVEQSRRAMEKELQQAAQIQLRLLPSSAPQLPGVDIAGSTIPCRTVGGDYYDFLPHPGGRVSLIVADVAGKGMPAALMVSSLQAQVHVLFEGESDSLADKVTRLNKAICRNCPDNRFITFFVCVLDPRTGELTYCNAGHNSPLIVRADGRVEKLSGGGVVLGILPVARYQQQTAQLELGDILVLYSDGISEAAPSNADEEFGEDRLGQVVFASRDCPALDILPKVTNAVAQFTHGVPAADDLTLVVARRLPSLEEPSWVAAG